MPYLIGIMMSRKNKKAITITKMKVTTIRYCFEIYRKVVLKSVLCLNETSLLSCSMESQNEKMSRTLDNKVELVMNASKQEISNKV